ARLDGKRAIERKPFRECERAGAAPGVDSRGCDYVSHRFGRESETLSQRVVQLLPRLREACVQKREELWRIREGNCRFWPELEANDGRANFGHRKEGAWSDAHYQCGVGQGRSSN